MKKIKKIIKKIIWHRPVFNYFKSNFKQKVLISYITEPFKKELKFSHSNKLEALKIAEIFHELGFIVDIYDFEYSGKVNFQKYKVIFGIGSLMEKSLHNKQDSIKYISYATGAYFCFANSAEINRLGNLFKRKNELLEPKRFVSKPTYLASQLSDAMIITGNDWTKSTYINSKMPISKVPVSVYNIEWKYAIKRKINTAKKNFLWFGSSGLVHKGLDLCLEVFKNLPDYNLYICGPKEKDFFELYENEFKLENIHYLGFMNIQSIEFKKIVETCMFSIFPSCSEGQSGSLLTSMSLGLIPIATLETGVDFKENGFLITHDIENIKNKVIEVSTLSKEVLTKLSIQNEEYIQHNHTIECFIKAMKYNLITIIKETNG